MRRIEGGVSRHEMKSEPYGDQLWEIGNVSAPAIMSRDRTLVTDLIGKLKGLPTDISEGSRGWVDGIYTVLKKADERLSLVDPLPRPENTQNAEEVLGKVKGKGYLTVEKAELLADHIVDGLLNDDGYSADILYEGFQGIYNSTFSNTELRDEDYRTYDRNLGKIAGMLQIINQPNE